MRYIFSTLAAVVVVAIVGALVVIYSGGAVVSATEGHHPITRWVLHTAMERAVKSNAQSIQAPAGLERHEALLGGVLHYEDTCAGCHGAPGKEPFEGADTMQPEPPDLAQTAEEWSNEELYWIVSNGVRLSGMPAFGPKHEPDELWDIVAFLRRLPDMRAREYDNLVVEARAVAARSGHRHAHGEDRARLSAGTEKRGEEETIVTGAGGDGANGSEPHDDDHNH